MKEADQVNAHYSSTDMRPDQFDHADWSKAQPVVISRLWSGQAAPAGRHAEVRILWTEEALAVRFVCQQREPLFVNSHPQLDKKTMGLWERDVCEIFIAPDPARPNHYFEFEAAPTGEWIDLAVTAVGAAREKDWEFHSGMTTASRITKGKITIALRIPWDDWIHKPQRGEKWRVNLFRCIGAGRERYLAWQPTHTPEPDFHVPEAFGSLSFV
jgi:hypothetical protein